MKIQLSVRNKVIQKFTCSHENFNKYMLHHIHSSVERISARRKERVIQAKVVPDKSNPNITATKSNYKILKIWDTNKTQKRQL